MNDSDYPFKYSNFGIVTLGAVLEQIYDNDYTSLINDYTSLINDYISDDLGLANTKVSDGSGDLGNYWKWSKTDAYAATGAILSNITDMMQYLKIHIDEKLDYLSIAHESLAEVDEVTCWLTGYDIHRLRAQIDKGVDFETFFFEAPQINPNAYKITGVICGVRVEEIEDPLMQKNRWLDKLVDELAKGKTMDKILKN